MFRNARKLDLILVEEAVGDEWSAERGSHLLCALRWLGVVSADKRISRSHAITIHQLLAC